MSRAPTPIRARMGPLTAAELASIGVDTVERLVARGWQDVFVSWIEAYPVRLNVNAAVGLVAAVEGVSWLRLSARDKEHARAFVEALRATRRPARRER